MKVLTKTGSNPTEDTEALFVDQNDLLTRLPEELQLRVLSFITPKELTGTVAKICRQWWQLSQDPLLWRKITLVLYSEEQIKACKHVLKRCSLLNSLKLVTRRDPNELMLLVSSFPSKLKVLDIRYCNLTTKDLEAIVNTCKYIEEIKVFSCKVDINHFSTIVSLKNLHSIEMYWCKHVDDECIKTIARGCANLKRIVICDCGSGQGKPITDESVYDIVQHHGSTLQEFEIFKADLTDKSVISICTCCNLTILRLSEIPLLTDLSLEAIGSTKLKVLELFGQNFNKHALAAFLKKPCISMIEELTIDKMPFDDNIIRELVAASVNLRSLTIIRCKELTSNGLEVAVRKCHKIRTLRLKHMNQLTGEFLQYVPSSLPNLTTLEYEYCPRLHESLKQLSLEMPHLTVSSRLREPRRLL